MGRSRSPVAYIYPGTTILRNKLGIIDADELDALERRMFAARAAEGVLTGDFDLAHLQAIHRHLFQDVYDWLSYRRRARRCACLA